MAFTVDNTVLVWCLSDLTGVDGHGIAAHQWLAIPRRGDHSHA